MSDLMNLEDDAPPSADSTPAAPAPVAAAADPTPAAPPVVSDPDEDLAVDLPGGKMVPLDALKAARQEAKDAKARAADADTIRTQLAQAQGALSAFQQLQQQIQRAAPPAAPSAVEPNPDLIELARSLDYYRADGSPDLDRAAKHDAILQRRAEAIARQAMAPVQEQQARDLSARNFQVAVQTTTPNGIKPKAETLAWMWQNLPAAYTADPRVANVLPVLAVGLDLMAGQGSALPPAPAAPVNPPLYTGDTGSSQPRAKAALTDLERAVLTQRGMTEAKYAEHTKAFRPGRPTTLED